MKEYIFAMKVGTEVPKQFDGITVPISAPGNNDEMIKLAGEHAWVIFNRAYVLDVQKAVKLEAVKEGATVEKLRAVPSAFKIGEPKTRAAGTGKPRVSPKQFAQALGDDFLSSLSPEQRAKYDAKMAELNAKLAKPNNEPAPTPQAAPSGGRNKAK